MKLARLAALFVAVATTATACGTDDNTLAGAVQPSGSASCATGTLTGAGSTFQKNIELQWIKDFAAQCAGATIDYKGVGSGAGISQFGEGTIDFAGSDSLMKDDEQAKADERCGPGNKAIHIPNTAGGVVLIYNLPGVSDLQLSAPTIAGMFQGTITKWNDPAVAADNPGKTLPAIDVQAVHRSDGSGTTDIFSMFLDATTKDTWKLGVGKELDWPGGQSAKGSDGVTTAVKSTRGGITYTELSYATSNDLPWAKVRNAGGTYVDATGDTVSKALAAAKFDESKGDLRVEIDFATKDPGAYPVSAVSYVIVCNKGNKNLPLLKAFLTYAMGPGQAVAGSLGYAPLPVAVATRVLGTVESLA